MYIFAQYVKDLVEFRRRSGERKSNHFSATCASKKILLGLQTCAPSAQGRRCVRCSQAASLFVKK